MQTFWQFLEGGFYDMDVNTRTYVVALERIAAMISDQNFAPLSPLSKESTAKAVRDVNDAINSLKVQAYNQGQSATQRIAV